MYRKPLTMHQRRRGLSRVRRRAERRATRLWFSALIQWERPPLPCSGEESGEGASYATWYQSAARVRFVLINDDARLGSAAS